MTLGDQQTPGILAACMIWCVRVAAFTVVVCTLLPLVRTGWWLVRSCDFPRLHLAGVCVALLLTALGFAWRYGWRPETSATCIVIASVFLWQAVHVLPYTRLWRTSVESGETKQVRLLVANLDFENRQHADVVRAIESQEPDVLLLVEIDETWERELGELADRFPHRVGEVRDNGLGIALWSRMPLDEARVEHRVSEDRPSINATLDIGGMPIRFVGVHPTPPALAKRSGTGRHNSRIRDAELVLVAEDVAADAEAVWIVAGDFNDVAWSHTTRLFRRLSGLRDPRVGRGMFSTYHAEYPLLRYPLDHVFVSRGIRVAGLSRVRMPGSDHFAMLADLDLRDVGEGVNPTADPDDREEAAEVIDEGTEDAEDMGRSTP